MPKLNATKAAEVRKAGQEGSKFGLKPEGKYRVKLTEVESTTARPKPGQREGNPMWVWKFEIVEFLDTQLLDVESEQELQEAADALVGKEEWYRTVIMDKTLWDLDRVFAAFEAEPDTDTDELIGDEIVVMIVQSVITSGRRQGQLGNEITEFFTLRDGLPADEPAAGVSTVKEDEPAF